jgi:hypothetical protein
MHHHRCNVRNSMQDLSVSPLAIRTVGLTDSHHCHRYRSSTHITGSLELVKIRVRCHRSPLRTALQTRRADDIPSHRDQYHSSFRNTNSSFRNTNSSSSITSSILLNNSNSGTHHTKTTRYLHIKPTPTNHLHSATNSHKSLSHHQTSSPTPST